MSKDSFVFPRSHVARQPHLTMQRDTKMAASAHRYARFYDWLDSARATLPEGPHIWICGDCHVGNLGPVAHADGRVEIEIRDLDQTVIGNPAHDVIRLALSLAMSARASDLSGLVTAHMVEAVVHAYEAALSRRAKRTRAAQVVSNHPLRLVMKEAAHRSWRQLLSERLGHPGERLIPIGKRFWPLTATERKAIDVLFARESVRKLVTSLKARDDDSEIEVVDAAFWVKGCSSLGSFRAAVLTRTRGKGHKGKKHTAEKSSAYSIVDIKEALPACAPRSKKAGMPRHNGERVVTGARHLSPFLGDRMMHETILDKTVFIRELMPQDLKIELDGVTAADAVDVARHLASIVATAHARQLSPEDAKKWLAELRRSHSKTIDAPSWLWRSVVELAGVHESAYLEHCKKIAAIA